MITVTVTGNLTDDPRPFSTRDGQPGCELRIAVDLPARAGNGDGPTRYFKVVTSPCTVTRSPLRTDAAACEASTPSPDAAGLTLMAAGSTLMTAFSLRVLADHERSPK